MSDINVNNEKDTMTIKLTAQQILDVLDTQAYPNWPWEKVIENYVYAEEEFGDAKAAARFLANWRPGRQWEAKEFYGLMYHHVNGRYESAAELGAIRAHEEHEDGNITDERLAEIIASDESAAAFATNQPGTYCFTDVDGTVLALSGLSAGIEIEPMEE